MVIRNKSLIALVCLVIGLGVMLFYGNFLYRMISYSIDGEKYIAVVSGFKVSQFGAKKVEDASGTASYMRGRSPWYQWRDNNGVVQEQYSSVPQIFVLFNYSMNEEVKIAYPIGAPEKSVILSWKELPGIILMLLFGFLSSLIGFSMLKKKILSS